jgi:hypothetical protein
MYVGAPSPDPDRRTEPASTLPHIRGLLQENCLTALARTPAPARWNVGLDSMRAARLFGVLLLRHRSHEVFGEAGDRADPTQ